jgi:hypothetical protein
MTSATTHTTGWVFDEDSIEGCTMKNSNIPLCLFCFSILLLAGCGQSSRDLQPEEIWTRVSPSVVRVEAKSLEGDTLIGSGFVCELNGKKVILSNRHVVLGAKEVRVGSSAEKLFRSPGYRISPDLDLALIDLPKELQIASLKTRTGGVRIGERIFTVGFPMGLNKSITQGLVSSETEQLVQFDAAISSGNSGGPLVDKDGSVLGVVTAGSIGSGDEIVQNLNFAIKTSFVPKAELFTEPIVRFYDAWRKLVGVENSLIDGLQDRRVFDVEKCVETEFALRLALATQEDIANLAATNRAKFDEFFNESCGNQLDRVIRRYGSLDAGLTNVDTFLRSQIPEFDRIPDIFAGLGSDDLLKQFSQDKRQKTFYTWDIKPSEIVPLLKISIEFTKAHYEDEAYKIEFCSQMLNRLKKGDTNFIAILTKADDKWIGERTTVRLPYNKLGPNATDEERVRLYFLCDQTYGHRSTSPWRKSLENQTLFEKKASLTEQISEYGGFEGWITAMLFGKQANERLERGDVQSAIDSEINEVEMRRYPDLGFLSFLYACRGDFEKAYEFKGKAYMNTFQTVDPFNLTHGSSLAVRMFLLNDFTDNRHDSTYSDSIKANMRTWTRFVARKSAFVLAQPITNSPIETMAEAERLLPETMIGTNGNVNEAEYVAKGQALAEVSKTAEQKAWASALNARFLSPDFDSLSEFEKCWVIDAQDQSAVSNGRLGLFMDLARTNSATTNLYQRYFEFQ